MIKHLLVIIGLLFSLCLPAQIFTGETVLNNENVDKQRWSWGYYVGMNTYDYNFDYKTTDLPPYEKDISVEQSLGFNVGLVGNLRINDYLDLRLEPGVSFNSLSLDFNVPKAELGNSVNQRDINLTYVHVPLLLKVSTKRLKNFKPFIVGGVSTSFNLSSNEDNPDDNLAGEFRSRTNSYYYELGFGIDFYLYYFKFTPSLRGVFGLSDDLIRDSDPASPFTGNIDKMSMRGVFLNFTFQ